MDDDSVNNREFIAECIATEFKKHHPINCSIGIDKDQHDRHHRFVASLENIAEKLDKIKWGTLGAIAKSAGAFLILAIVVGAFVLAKIKLSDLS